ncbi:MAG: hypothetical protein KAI79_19025, partial [Bacteroidales bacterium]|nr:hypothetical protein [Bacteroidales bacterium]
FIIEDIFKSFHVKVGRETIRLSLNKSRAANQSVSNVKTAYDRTSSDTNKSNETETFFHAQTRDTLNVFRNQYCGLLLMGSYAHLVFDGFDDQHLEAYDSNYNIKEMIVWWILSIFSGALNLEQQRYFAINDFEFISGFKNFPSVESMRDHLHNMSLSQELEVSTILLKKNIDYFIEDTSDYYLDPHIEEYTGKKNILPAWSTLKNRVCKSSVDTYVHDSAGNPLFSVLEDSFYDFREVIIRVMEKLETLFKQKSITLIYDRGGFSVDLMKEIDSHKNIFITWQKGFVQKDAEGLSFKNKIEIQYPYNDLGKFEIREFKYTEDIWKSGDFSCRRIIFQKGNDKTDKFFYQSILSNDQNTDAGLILKKIIKRTLQENDFKKEKNHFGIDAITSYRSLAYNALDDKDPNKKTKNKKYIKITNQIKELKIEKKKHLAKLGIKAIEKKHLNSKFYERNKKLIDEVLALEQSIKEIEITKQNIDKEISKLEQVISEGKIELDLRMKRLLNLVKITTRNIT